MNDKLEVDGFFSRELAYVVVVVAEVIKCLFECGLLEFELGNDEVFKLGILVGRGRAL